MNDLSTSTNIHVFLLLNWIEYEENDLISAATV